MIHVNIEIGRVSARRYVTFAHGQVT